MAISRSQSAVVPPPELLRQVRRLEIRARRLVANLFLGQYQSVFGAWLIPGGWGLQASGGTPTWVWAALLMAAFAGLTVLTMALVRFPVLRTPPPFVAPAEAADEAARRELGAIAGAGLIERGELKEYYRRIASCLREYLSRRFDLPAVAMTAQELGGRLEALAVDRWPARLAVNLLEQCQAVQFARYEPARERAEADLSSAYEVVALTGPSEEAPQPDEWEKGAR